MFKTKIEVVLNEKAIIKVMDIAKADETLGFRKIEKMIKNEFSLSEVEASSTIREAERRLIKEILKG